VNAEAARNVIVVRMRLRHGVEESPDFGSGRGGNALSLFRAILEQAAARPMGVPSVWLISYRLVDIGKNLNDPRKGRPLNRRLIMRPRFCSRAPRTCRSSRNDCSHRAFCSWTLYWFIQMGRDRSRPSRKGPAQRRRIPQTGRSPPKARRRRRLPVAPPIEDPRDMAARSPP